MATNAKEKPSWFAVFRTDENTVDWLYEEVIAGRLYAKDGVLLGSL